MQERCACTGGNLGPVSVSGTGGTAPYQYKLNNGVPQASGIFSGLASGSYVITVTDLNGCSNNISVTILQVANTIAPAIASKVDVSCGGAPGSVTLSATVGPTLNYRVAPGFQPPTLLLLHLLLCCYVRLLTAVQGYRWASSGPILASTVISKTVYHVAWNGSVTIAVSGGAYLSV